MTEESNEKILVKIKRKVGVITLNNGDMNVFSPDFIFLFRDTLKQLKENKKVNVILIQSASERSFSAGFDLKELQGVNPEFIDILLKDGYEIVELIQNMAKPVISLINGYSIGAGFLFPLAGDFRYSTKDAKFQLPEVNFADLMFVTHGGCTSLPKLVNKLSDAYYIAMTGEKIDAETAFKMGVVDRVFDSKEEMINEGFNLAKLIASKSPFLIGMIKAVIRKNLNSSVTEGLALEKEAYAIIREMADPKREEKRDKFIEKNING